jgi:hypothetical protein
MIKIYVQESKHVVLQGLPVLYRSSPGIRFVAFSNPWACWVRCTSAYEIVMRMIASRSRGPGEEVGGACFDIVLDSCGTLSDMSDTIRVLGCA